MQKTVATAVLAAIVLTAGVARAADPVCGDVNNSSSITTTDALLVLKKSVSQPITLNCSAYDDQLSACSTSLYNCDVELFQCQNSLQLCGNGTVDPGEDCEAGEFNGNTCATEGFEGGTLVCAAGCTFDTTGCYATRFDASGPTIIDHKTGLEWEKKTSTVGSGPNYTDPHDVDNVYSWTAEAETATSAANGTAFTDFLDKLNGQAGAGTGFAGHYDWRLPTIVELDGIVDCGSGSPCIASVFGPTQSDNCWSSSTSGQTPSSAYYENFNVGAVYETFKVHSFYVRAVRDGS